MIKILFSDQTCVYDATKPMIFLAGPTSRVNKFSLSWRKDACDILEKIGFDGTVCVPEFGSERPFKPEDWDAQTNWEWNLLDRADCILFWVPRTEEMPGLTTNLEFGTYLEKRPSSVIYGRPDTAIHCEWMDKRFKKETYRDVWTTLENTLRAAKELAEFRADIRFNCPSEVRYE